MEKETITLVGKKCILAEGREEFAEHIANFSNNYKIWRNTSDNFSHPYQKEDAIKFIDATCSTKRGIFFVIFISKQNEKITQPLDYSTLEAVGGTMFKQSNESANVKHTNEIGYWIGEQYWGKGIATEAVQLMTNYGFSEKYTPFNQNIPLERIVASIFAYNTPSVRVVEKNGYYLEARQKKALKKEGKLQDALLYVKLKEE